MFILIFFVDDNIDNIEDNDPLLIDDLSKDKDYEQVDEADDETTMEEEEALPELEDPLREIRFLEEVICLQYNFITQYNRIITMIFSC